MGTMAFTVADFNAAPTDRLTPELTDIFGSPALAESVAASRPYDSVDQLCATASALLTAQDRESRQAVCDAVNAHPPIGGTVAAGTRSAGEQAAADGGEELDDLRELQPRYREHFGWNYLVRAAGRSSREIRDNLLARLDNPPADEWPVAVANLDAINQLRLRGWITD
jgi:2-oxo-4-hydroxy-4-carboxy-5-ureidoimidazoline decarboxylase